MSRLLGLLFTLPAGCSGGAAESKSAHLAAPPPPRPSLVLVTLDTTRADHLGIYGDPEAATPTIDQLATGGAWFARAYAAVPLTTPSHSSMLTGLYPPRTGVHTNGDAALPDSLITLAEVLQAKGWHTAASVGAFVTTRVWNLDQGFDQYFDDVGPSHGTTGRWGRERSAGEVVDDAIQWLDGLHDDQPFFLWVHVYDPHRPFDPPEPYATRFKDRPYDGEIAYVDSQLARLKKVVDDTAGEAGAAWLVVADHGEALRREHGERSHGMFLFEPTMRVPFIVCPPNPTRPGPGRIDGITVSGVDVMPTALGLVGVTPPSGIDGIDLSGVLAGDRPTRPPVYMESETLERRFGYATELAAAVTRNGHTWKLMDTPDRRLYDVDADPDEEKNLIADHLDLATKLHEEIVSVTSQSIEAGGKAPSPEVVEQLQALGYVVGTPAPVSHPEIDGKDRLAIIDQVEKARELGQLPGKAAEAEKAYRAILQKEPQLAEVRMGLAKAVALQGRLEEAEQIFRKALELEPDSAILKTNLAMNLATQGRKEEALAELKKVLEQVPDDDLAELNTLRLLSDLNRVDEALDLARTWLARNPNSAALKAHIGVLLARQGKLDEAEPMLRASLEDGVPRQFVHWMLARVAEARGDTREAARELQLELEWFPNQPSAHLELANANMVLRRFDEAAAEYRYVSESRPDDVSVRRSWAQATFNTGDYDLAAQILAPALAAAPDDADILLLHANILAKQGRRDEGEEVFMRAKALKQAEREQMSQAPTALGR